MLIKAIRGVAKRYRDGMDHLYRRDAAITLWKAHKKRYQEEEEKLLQRLLDCAEHDADQASQVFWSYKAERQDIWFGQSMEMQDPFANEPAFIVLVELCKPCEGCSEAAKALKRYFYMTERARVAKLELL